MPPLLNIEQHFSLCFFAQLSAIPDYTKHATPSDSLTWFKPICAFNVGAAFYLSTLGENCQVPIFIFSELRREGYKTWFPLTVVLRVGQDPALRFNDRRAALQLPNLADQ